MPVRVLHSIHSNWPLHFLELQKIPETCIKKKKKTDPVLLVSKGGRLGKGSQFISQPSAPLAVEILSKHFTDIPDAN